MTDTTTSLFIDNASSDFPYCNKEISISSNLQFIRRKRKEHLLLSADYVHKTQREISSEESSRHAAKIKKRAGNDNQ